MPELKTISWQPDRQEYWKTKRDLMLENVYANIASDIPLVNVSHKELFLQQCKRYYSEMVSNYSDVTSIDRWDEYEIVRMFGKGLNPTSLKTALNNIIYLVNNLRPTGDVIRIVEYGPGSGWSTLMLRNKLYEKFKDRRVEIYSVDMSPHSVVATQNSLDYYQIPWQTVLDPSDVSQLPHCNDCVTLVVGDFLEFTKNQKPDYFDGYFSSHGTAYLSEDEYKQLLKLMVEKGKNESIFVADSLDPKYTVQLDTLHLLLCSIFPSLVKNMPEYVYGKSVMSNSKYFAGQEVKKLTKVHNKESNLFYNWNNYLLSKGKFLYILQMLVSIRITTQVIDEYRDDVYPCYMVTKLALNEEDTKWEILNDLPTCPLYITNCGLKVKK